MSALCNISDRLTAVALRHPPKQYVLSTFSYCRHSGLKVGSYRPKVGVTDQKSSVTARQTPRSEPNRPEKVCFYRKPP